MLQAHAPKENPKCEKCGAQYQHKPHYDAHIIKCLYSGESNELETSINDQPGDVEGVISICMLGE